MSRARIPFLLPLLALASLAPAQRGLRLVTVGSTDPHTEAKISGSGTTIAFRGTGKIGVVPYSGGAETILVTSATLGEFLWTPSGGGLYFVDGTAIKYVTRTGGSPLTIRTIPGTQVHMWCVTGDDKTIYGSRYDSTTAKYSIFTLATNGQSAPVDIVQSVVTLDAVAIDPTNTKIAYREYYGGTPFSPREYWLANANGSGAVSLTNGQINGQLDQPEFTDAGTTIAFTSIATTIPTFQIGTLTSGNPAIQYLTESPGLARRSSVFPDRSWIACEVSVPPAVGPRIAIIPATGGGRVLLDPNLAIVMQGNPSADASGTRVVCSAIEQNVTTIPQIYAVELDRELRISPRLEVGKVVTLELPVGANDLGGYFLAGGLSGTPFTVGGILYSYDLDLATSIPLYSGTSTSGSLVLPLPLPNDPALTGQVVWWQGVRVNVNTLTGDFSRPVSTRIF